METRKHQPSLRLLATLALLVVATAMQAQTVADSHLYAVLVSGGRNRLMNHERYWNDCAFLYRTLRQRYHLPKSHITVLMSDGAALEADMLKADGTGFVSSPTDLDGDGQSDVAGAATRQTLFYTMLQLSCQLTTDDSLFLFVTDHGGSDDKVSDSFLWLWGEDKLYDYSLALLLDQLHVARISIVMGQCYGGGFVEELQHADRVVTTACAADEQSWACPDRDNDEFLYQWTCAINGADADGKLVNADTDGDGLVSMAEAFEYAKAHDRRSETPQYGSWPEALGGQWTFCGLAGAGIQNVVTAPPAAEQWSLSGVRQPVGWGLQIVRQGGRTRKVVR